MIVLMLTWQVVSTWDALCTALEGLGIQQRPSLLIFSVKTSESRYIRRNFIIC